MQNEVPAWLTQGTWEAEEAAGRGWEGGRGWLACGLPSEGDQEAWAFLNTGKAAIRYRGRAECGLALFAPPLLSKHKLGREFLESLEHGCKLFPVSARLPTLLSLAAFALQV